MTFQQIQDGYHLENREIAEKSPDLMKFGTAVFKLVDCHVVNMKLFKINSRRRTAARLKIVFGLNSVADFPISVKFCEEKQFSSEFRQLDIMEFHRTYFFTTNVHTAGLSGTLRWYFIVLKLSNHIDFLEYV